jgi:ATP-binding cassette, subfamily B, multidrug efflux pump
MNWQLTLVSLIPLPILLVATYYFKESVNKSFIKVRNAVAALNAFVQEHITGMSLVQAFAAEKREFGKFDTINKQHRNANIKAIFAYSVFFPVVEVVLAVSMGLQVWWIAGQQLEAGLLVSFILYINLIFRPLRVIADKFNVLQMGIIASERVFAVLDTASEPSKETNITIPHWPQGAAISFKKVQFSYQPGVPVLKNIEFSVEPGTTVALVGHTGSGKTSIISVLNKFYPIQAGEVTINGVNIEQVSTASLRQNIGVVLQDVFLFSGTLLENITLRNPTITEQQVVDAAKLLHVHHFIMQLPGGYQFNVMERGNTLSVGQRQIISFMRALLYNPYILVLDEATSSVDTESEQLIQNAIDKLIANRTSIVVAHRLSTIKKAHKILVLDKGELVEEGTHEQLLEQKGHYYQLHAMQTQNSPTG